MLEYNDITAGRTIVLDGEPYEVLASSISKKSRQKASNQAKLRHLASGKVVERAFHQSDTVAEADIAKKTIVYIYQQPGKGEAYFHPEGNKKERFALPLTLVAEALTYLRENTPIEAHVFDERIIGVKAPVKVDLTVREAPPSIKGNTAQGGTKQVVLENNATVSVPLFIEEGDVVRINTDTKSYVERVSKGR